MNKTKKKNTKDEKGKGRSKEKNRKENWTKDTNREEKKMRQRKLKE